MTRFELYVRDWKNCERCEYSQRRKRVVMGKGSLPCDILIIGEAPGDSEDVLGSPMVGQTGRLMDQMLVSVGIVTPGPTRNIWGNDANWKHTVSITNLIGCIPLLESREKEEPDWTCVMACRPRLEQWIEFAEPKLIITAGKPSEEWFDPTYRDHVPHGTIPVINIVHPAAILRKPFIERSVAVQREVVKIRIGVKNYIIGDSRAPTEESKAGSPQTRGAKTMAVRKPRS